MATPNNKPSTPIPEQTALLRSRAHQRHIIMKRRTSKSYTSLNIVMTDIGLNGTRMICFLAALCFFYSCGDILLSRKKIKGKYYLLEQDGGTGFSIAYKLGQASYIGRIPADIIEYGWNDSVLVAKTNENGKVNVYILDIKADFEFAEKDKYLLDSPQSEASYAKNWQDRLRIKFKKVD